MWTTIIMDKNKASRKGDPAAIEDNEKVTPARGQIQPLADGLTGINQAASARSLQHLRRLPAWRSLFSLFLNVGFEMGYALPQYNRILNV